MESSGGDPLAPPPSPPGDGPLMPAGDEYPLTYSVEYPDRPLSRLTTALRIFWAIPIFILAATIEGGGFGGSWGGSGARYGGGGVGILVIPVVLMLLFRQKYPRWWFDWNLRAHALLEPRHRLPRADGRPLSLDRRAAGGAP